MAQAIKLPKPGDITLHHSVILEVVTPAPIPRQVPGITHAQVKVKTAKGNEKTEDYLVVWK